MSDSQAWDSTVADYESLVATTNFTPAYCQDLLDVFFSEKREIKNVIHQSIQVIDIATGTGALPFLLSPVLPPGGSILATDFSPQMVSFVEQKTKQRGINNISTKVMDAQVFWNTLFSFIEI